MENRLLRHLLATLSFRAMKAIQDAPSHYASLEMGKGVRTPVEILHHMSDVLGYALKHYGGGVKKQAIGSWEAEVDRFYGILEELDQKLEDGATPHGLTEEQILQGPFSDALTHWATQSVTEVGRFSRLR